MKKIRPFLFATFFVIFVAFGFVFSKSFLFPVIIQSSPTPFPTPAYGSTISQDTVLLLHVDNLEKPQPKLISAWGIFITNTEPVGIILKNIYPPAKQITRKPVLSDAFVQGRHLALPDDFSNLLISNNFKWDHYLVLDNQAISGVVNWKTGKIPRLHSITPGSAENNKIIFDEEKIVMESVCASFGNPESITGPQPLWDELARKNMLTNFYFDDALILWQRLTVSSPSPRCEIIATQ